METYTKIARLISKFRKNSLSEQEQKELHDWLESSEKNRELFKRLLHKRHRKISKKAKAVEWNKIVRSNNRKPGLLLSLGDWEKIIAAAVIIVLLSIPFIKPFLKPNECEQTNSAAVQESPGKIAMVTPIAKRTAPVGLNPNFPLLLLPNGSVIQLDKEASGPIARIDNIEITNNNGQLEYNPIRWYSANTIQPFTWFSENALSTIYTSKSSKYKVKLWEGTKISLNTCSVLQFPLKSDATERNVKLSGEGFFNVTTQYSKSGKLPFYVEFDKARVNVLGTKFNIMAFPNEKIAKVTLVEGSVEISKDSITRVLKPSQQIELGNDGKVSAPKDVSVEEALAWKEGKIKLKGASLEEVMQQISRLYNVEVEFKATTSNHFTIHIPPHTPLREAMERVIYFGEIKYKIDGKRIIVTK